MKNKGVCTWQTMPYSTENGCSIIPTSSQLNEASNYKITSYSWLYESDQTAIKTMLINKHAVIIMIQPDASFWNATSGFIWKTLSGSQTTTHSVAICGYDDAKHAYKVMNSWGTSWGDAGYSWIDYDFLPYTGSGIGYVIN
jgi:C1A family cysteine protease